MLGLYYNSCSDIIEETGDTIKDNKWTPAEVANLCKTNKSLEKCIESLSC